jgi:GrpB-like predicted nucleotidyltransferase (UPF0157 family)
VSERPQIVEYDKSWPEQFESVALRVREALAGVDGTVEHIGSTAVPGLAAKDVIDVMAVVGGDADLARGADVLAAAGWKVRPAGQGNDHLVPGLSSDPAQWVKRFASEPSGVRRTNLHVRVLGRANQRYAILFRDFLKAHPEEAARYAEAKRELAQWCESTRQYAEEKDPVCDAIYLSAERWAGEVGWRPRPWAGN